MCRVGRKALTQTISLFWVSGPASNNSGTEGQVNVKLCSVVVTVSTADCVFLLVFLAVSVQQSF